MNFFNRKEVKESYEKLDFSSDAVFTDIMRDSDLCRRVIESLLKIKIERVVYHKTQKWLRPANESRNAHGVRLDVYLKDSGRVFDIEMQAKSYSNLPKRARYYQSCMDFDNLMAKQKYEDLKESYVIFICKSDPFSAGIPIYTVQSRFREKENEIYDDFSRKVFYNASAWEKCGDPEIRSFLKYIATRKSSSSLTDDIEERVKFARRKLMLRDIFPFRILADIEWEKSEMREHIYALEQQALKKGMKEGLEKGMQEGIEKGKQESQAIIEEQAKLIAQLQEQLAQK